MLLCWKQVIVGPFLDIHRLVLWEGILLQAAAVYCATTLAAGVAWTAWFEHLQGRILQPGDPHSILKLLPISPVDMTARHPGASRASP